MARTTYKCSNKKKKKKKTKQDKTKKQETELRTLKETPDTYIGYNPFERCPAEKWFLQEEAAEAVIYRVQNRTMNDQTCVVVVQFAYFSYNAMWMPIHRVALWFKVLSEVYFNVYRLA